jgi:hypothetical protein
MFNSPILDVAIGLVFIFLLYSLLATSIKEGFATLFALRARMLKKGIEGMLSETPGYGRWKSIGLGILSFLKQVWVIITGKPAKKEEKIGDKFYAHPLIKNYGSSRIFPFPSYIPTDNFSTVLLDLLKQDFNDKIENITKNKKEIFKLTDSDEVIKKNLQNSSTAIKIKELLDYYSKKESPDAAIIDKDTLSILQMHLRNSVYDIEVFAKKLEDWFDDSMNRVSGWYKRQVQFILFIIGLIIAIVFNVDTLQIAGKLTTDKDARDKIVQLAIKSSDQYKDDPRVKTINPGDNKRDDSAITDSNEKIFIHYQNKIDSAKNELNGNIASANNLLALGWGDYGMIRDSNIIHAEYKAEFDTLVNRYLSDTSRHFPKNKVDTLIANDTALVALYNEKHWIKLKVGYVLSETIKGKKVLGFLILAFAVCLGAPFWFDMLNKLIKLRGSGKKEDGDSNSSQSANTAQPVAVTINNQQTGEEAVG